MKFRTWDSQNLLTKVLFDPVPDLNVFRFCFEMTCQVLSAKLCIFLQFHSFICTVTSLDLGEP